VNEHAGRYYIVGSKGPFFGGLGTMGFGAERPGEVFIRSSVSHKKVWREKTGINPGESAGSLVRFIEDDPESLSVSEFEQKWKSHLLVQLARSPSNARTAIFRCNGDTVAMFAEGSTPQLAWA